MLTSPCRDSVGPKNCSEDSRITDIEHVIDVIHKVFYSIKKWESS